MAMSQMGNAAAQKIEQIARMISPSVEYLFSCAHELILKHGHKADTVKLAGKWVTVNPADWKRRKDLNIAVGLGSGNKDTVLGHLQQMFQMQMALLPMGVTEPKLIYNTVAEISKMAGFGSPDMFWKIPGPPQPQPPPPEVIKEQMRQQFEGQQADADRKFEAQKTQVTWQYEQQQEQVRQAFEANKQQIEQAFKAWLVQFQEQAKAENLDISEQNKADIAAMQDETKRAIAGMQGMLDRHAMTIDAEIREDKVQGSLIKSRTQMEKQVLGQLGEALEDLRQRIDGGKTVSIQKLKGPDGRTIGGRVTQADGTTRDVGLQ
jgi:hypothetical protein